MYDTTHIMANKNIHIINTKDFEWKFFKNNDIEIRFKLLLNNIIKPFFFTGTDNRA